MGDIYADTNFILTNIKKIYHILNTNYFRIGKDIEFDISLKRKFLELVIFNNKSLLSPVVFKEKIKDSRL